MSTKYSLDKSDSRHGGITVLDAEKRRDSKDDTVTRVLEVPGHDRQRRMSSYGGGRRGSMGVIQGPAGRRMSINPTAGMSELEKVEYFADVTEDGEVKFHKLNWVQLTVVLIVTAVALGTLSMPVYVPVPLLVRQPQRLRVPRNGWWSDPHYDDGTCGCLHLIREFEQSSPSVVARAQRGIDGGVAATW